MKSRGKQGKTGEKSQDTGNFALLNSRVRNSHHPTPLPEEALPQLPRAVIELPLCEPRYMHPHIYLILPLNADNHTRSAAATPVAPTQIPARSPPTKKAKTSEPGESSRAARDSQSQSPPTKRPILTSSPIEGNSDCRARAFHDEAYFGHYVLRQQPELGDSYRLRERVPYYQEVSLPPFLLSLAFGNIGDNVHPSWGGELRK
ncbi:hypothetical protein CK203_056508 [Vitis vinifera]|uniref:Uncharacterized protein n=1 Tax=Vitis vinifera TaxID=29760 RepID=A0A438GEK7_VITVI|nr:hypothetical protein CK203_056508 [Vitis vinifera]